MCIRDRANSEALVGQLFVGSAALLQQRGDPAQLRAMVTSPGGTTAAGVRALEEHAVRSAFLEAVMAATARSAEPVSYTHLTLPTSDLV